MLNRDLFLNVGIIIILILLQTYVFNFINLFGKYNPLVFIIYIMFAKPSMSFEALSIYSFLLGLGVDLFMYTPGYNAFCCLMAILVREVFLNKGISKGDRSFFKFRDLDITQSFIYIFTISIFYNILLYTIESFSWTNVLYNLREGFINGLVTFGFITIIYLLIRKRLVE